MIEWVEEEVGALGAPVLVQQGHLYQGRLLLDSSCANAGPVLTTLSVALTQDFSSVRFGRPVLNWPTDRIDFPHDPNTQCLVWISGVFKHPDRSIEPGTFTGPGVRLLDIWDQTTGQVLIDNRFTLPVTPPITPGAIPNLPFPLPSIPGASTKLVLDAIDALSRAGAACPQLAVPNGPLQHAATAFATFAALSISLGGHGSENLAALEQQLDSLCPNWRTTASSAPVPLPGPSLPPVSGDIGTLLAQLAAVLTTGAGSFGQLPQLAEQATSIGLPLLAQEINRFADQHGVTEPTAPPPDEPPPGPPPAPPGEEPPPGTTPGPAPKKKGISGMALAAIAILGIGIAVVVTRGG